MKLYSHPLASYCQKVLIALYELARPFEAVLVDLGDPAQRAALAALWPPAKFPVLVDGDVVVPESTIIVEHVDDGRLRSRDRTVRVRDRFFDNYVSGPMQAIVSDMLRPAQRRDSHGRSQAEADLRSAYAIAEAWLESSPWIAGDAFSMADCAAAPALRYSHALVPITSPRLGDYLARVSSRPSFARVIDEAAPYWHMFPGARSSAQTTDG